ncbi:MAG TPA: c-type cytochrome [Candidatus Accumulibacter phosphatis]|nr:MAG: Cytochrome c4 [Candidatus Accumulibacter sp. SK-11]HAY29466.1 cytochrome C [Accumulibacter sp.]HRL77911.1 c-type cytochrome [Candidatus Accumulibacter phosphatis]HCN67673.1 cytochrome C [Accumulibacter sp.]HCV13189.1 cytochrome C [Accumulibacter sp.]
MYKGLIVVVTLSLAAAHALAASPGDGPAASGSKDYRWNEKTAEMADALRLKGDVKAGQEDYKAYCEACHLPNGRGNPHGSIPQLAGQHPTVVIKQLADIRSGLRANPTMYPFAMKLRDAQAIANVAAYLGTLCVPRDSGKYEGADAAKLVAYGQVLYNRECVQCHQPNGDGVREKFYPVIAGQHYRYLLQQMVDIRDGKRRNSHPDMLRVIAKYDDAQLVAIAAYQAMLVVQQRQWTVQPGFCKEAADRL